MAASVEVKRRFKGMQGIKGSEGLSTSKCLWEASALRQQKFKGSEDLRSSEGLCAARI